MKTEELASKPFIVKGILGNLKRLQVGFKTDIPCFDVLHPHVRCPKV